MGNVLPEEFRERIGKITGETLFRQVIETFDYNRPVVVRVNMLLSTPKEVSQELLSAGIKYYTVDWYPHAFILPNATKHQITSLAIYSSGHIYIQGLSSMIPVLVLNPQPDEHILDIASAPGSKATQIAMHMNNTGALVLNDSSRDRTYKLKDNLKRMGVDNATIRVQPGQTIWYSFQEYFDRVLVDAPCSLEGMFTTQRPKTYAGWSVKKIKIISKLQQYLIRSAVSAAKPGATIVYSTCTLAPEENEAVIDWIIKKEKGAVEVEEINIPGLKLDAPLSSWNGKEFDPQVAKTARILPKAEYEAFYIAKLRKKRPTLVG